MKRLIAIVGLAATLSYGLDSKAAPTEDLKSQVNMMLSAPEYAPDKTEWLALGPDAASVLRNIALNKKELAVKRGRAATALTHFKTELTKQTLTRLVEGKREGWLLRGKAARALTVSFGEKTIPTVKHLLTAPNKRLREAAIRALSSITTKSSRDVLSAHVKVEKNKYLVRATQNAVRLVDARMLKLQQAAKEQKTGAHK